MQITVPGLTHSAVLDAEGTVVYVNDAFLTYASRARGREIRRKDRIGRNVREFIAGGYGYDRQEWLELYDRVLKKGETLFLRSLSMFSSPGREIYVDVRMNPIKGEDGKVLAAVFTWQDMTDRVNAQRAERRKAALDRVHVAVYEMGEASDLQHVLVSLYGAFKGLGVKFDDCSVQIVDEEKDIFECYYLGPDRVIPMIEQSLTNSAVYEAWRNGQPVYRRDLDEEDLYKDKSNIENGSDKHIRSVVDVPFSRGTIAINSLRPDAFTEADIATLKHFAGVLSEAYKRFEDIRRIEASEEKYRSVVEQSQDIIFKVDLEGNYLLISPVIQEVTGYSPEEFYADRMIGRRIVLPEDFEKASEGFRNASSGEASRDLEYRIRTKDGGITWVSQNTFPIEDSEGHVVSLEGTIRDITEHKRAEESLQQALRREEAMGRIRDRTIGTRHFSEFGSKIQKQWMAELVGLGIPVNGMSIQVPSSRSRTFRSIWLDRSLSAEDRSLSLADYPWVKEVWEKGAYALVSRESMGDCQPNIQCILEVPLPGVGSLGVNSKVEGAFDSEAIRTVQIFAGLISEGLQGVQDFEALQKSEERYRDLYENANDILYTQDMEGRFTSVNRAALRTFGYTLDELLTLSIADIVDPEYLPKARDMIAERTRIGQLTPVYELLCHTKDDTPIWMEVNTRPLLDGGRRIGVQGIARDITERKRAEEEKAQLEEQLLQSQKMEAIGRLAGGVAHDFNNLLTAIMGYSELLLLRLGPADPMRGSIEQIQKAGQRAASLTRQLLAFSRRQMLQPKVLDLNAVVADIEKMLRRLIGEDIELVVVLDPALGRVHADPGQIEQVILNLAVNARDAMPEGGKLIIETANAELDEAYAQSHAEVQPGSYVMLAMSDTGHGMDEETRSHIFEPFFTTKEVGKGTGLGLSTVYGIVKQSGGHIWAYSELEKGTTFRIYLPRVEEAAEGLPLHGASGYLPHGTETVLLVEDEPTVRDLATRVLSEQGYTVLEAANGEEALRVAQKHAGKEIHLLLTDVVMPLMGGPELAKQLKTNHPEARTLYTSGYTDNAIVPRGVLDPGTPFLQKPFTPEVLTHKVREVLDAPR